METVEGVNPKITRVGTPEDLARAAFGAFVNNANQAIKDRGSFNVAISGGHTPERFFELLGDNYREEAVPWDKIHIFWVDERCVPPEAEASNYGLAAHTFLDKVPIPTGNVHRMSGEADSYERSVREYEETIRRVFHLAPGQMPRFDMIVLGMGEDGHIGSLFPTSFALYDTEDLVSAVYLMDDENNKYNRITLTHPVICAALHLMILVCGSEKAEILRDVFHSELDEVKYPVHTLWPILDKVSWIVDSQAAKHI